VYDVTIQICSWSYLAALSTRGSLQQLLLFCTSSVATAAAAAAAAEKCYRTAYLELLDMNQRACSGHKPPKFCVFTK